MDEEELFKRASEFGRLGLEEAVEVSYLLHDVVVQIGGNPRKLRLLAYGLCQAADSIREEDRG